MQFINHLCLLTGIITTISIDCLPALSLHQNNLTEIQRYENRVTTIDRQKCKETTKKKYQGLTYELCLVNGKVTYAYGDGPPGDAGPAAYLKNGKLIMFSETAATEFYLFQGGELEAQVSMASGSKTKVKTSWTLAERDRIMQRVVSYTNDMLKVFGRKL